MTRARLIEKVIGEWFERNSEFVIYEDVGIAEVRLEVASRSENSGIVQFDVGRLASDIDAELDRIIRETKS